MYKVYTDRSPVANDEYAYKMPDGSYSKVKDLDPLRKILASYLFIEIKNGNARDKNAGKYYDSLYNISYFDGVLTIELDSSSAIPEWMLYKLVVDDVERYFEYTTERLSWSYDGKAIDKLLPFEYKLAL